MVDYRGVDKQDVINSLKQAEAFLQQLDIGPETAKVLHDWLAKDPYIKIQAAQDNKALAQAMSETGTADVFDSAAAVFYHHALLDTDGLGKRVCENLCVWGAFAGKTLSQEAGDEAGAYAFAETAKMAVARKSPFHPQTWHIKKKSADEWKEDYLQADMLNRYKLGKDFYKASGLARKAKKLNIQSPFEQYGIEIKDFGKSNRDTSKTKEMKEQMRAALAPFHETGEVNKASFETVISSIDNERKRGRRKYGYAFTATKQAAQAVADQTPGYKLIDSKGKQITPSAKPVIPSQP
jgi:hypothetical protein